MSVAETPAVAVERVVRTLDVKTEAAIQDRALASTRHILFPGDTRTDEEVVADLCLAIKRFQANKKAGKLKPVGDNYKL